MFNLEDYETVEERLIKFWKDHPDQGRPNDQDDGEVIGGGAAGAGHASPPIAAVSDMRPASARA